VVEHGPDQIASPHLACLLTVWTRRQVLLQALLSGLLVGGQMAWDRFQGQADQVTQFFQR
jgi:hypothetical protein